MPASQVEAMAAAAELAVTELREPFIRTSLRNLDRLRQLFSAAMYRADGWRAEAYRLAHDLKGQGTTFDFELVSRIAHALCLQLAVEPTEGDAARDKRALAHCEALRVILTKDIRGMGGEHGARLLKILSIEP
ncbi:MAG: Hpt domain-containing protein [Rhodospirillaceae bacterium]|nr:Hpt domain-containing protein [Rhodospirillaceae bacterium]